MSSFASRYHLRAVLDQTLTLFRHAGEQFMKPGRFVAGRDDIQMTSAGAGWEFPVGGTGFSATFGLELDYVLKMGRRFPSVIILLEQALED